MSDVWHTPPETPNVFKPQPIIVVYEAGDQIEQMDSTEWSGLVGERYVNRWCYVDDLIKENYLTCKELEQSEICCTEWEKQALDYKAENIALSGDLERTRKALDVAVAGLEKMTWGCDSSDAEHLLKEITALEQKDK